MKNASLAKDYIQRARFRLKALDVLMSERDWPDVVREAQEIVELSLKALLRRYNIDSPRIHDVGQILSENVSMLPAHVAKHATLLQEISHDLRRDRELAFYGSEDLTPLQFYGEKDAVRARDKARKVTELVEKEFQ